MTKYRSITKWFKSKRKEAQIKAINQQNLCKVKKLKISYK